MKCPVCDKEGIVDRRSGYIYCSDEECEVANITSWIAMYGDNKESVEK